MLKKMLAGVSLSVLMVGSALAHDVVDTKGGAVAVENGTDPAPGPTAVPGPPPVETPEAKAEVAYRFGITGFLRRDGAGNFSLSQLTYQPQHSEGRFLYRIKPYAFWHPTDYLDLHLEGQGYGFSGGGADDWQLSLYQGYVEARLPDSKLLSLKGGRQEFTYGSNFMLGADAFFNGLTFDSGRLRIRPDDTFTVDILGGSYASPSADGVKGNIFGTYATWTLSEGNALEYYYLRDSRELAYHPNQVVNSFGLRGTAKTGPVSLEIEPIYQTGDVSDDARGGNSTLSAYGGHADLIAEGDTGGFHHKLWAGYAIGSGSRAAAEGTSKRHQFSNSDNDTAVVGDMHVAADLSGVDVNGHHASGLQIYTLGWGVDFTKEVNLSATGHYFTAGAVQSGLSRNLGLETDFALTYALAQNYSLILAYDHFFTGNFFKGASGSGDDIHYGYAMLQFNLEKSKLKGSKEGR